LPRAEYALLFFLFLFFFHDFSIILRVLGKEAFSLTGNKFIRYYLVFDQSAHVASQASSFNPSTAGPILVSAEKSHFFQKDF